MVQSAKRSERQDDSLDLDVLEKAKKDNSNTKSAEGREDMSYNKGKAPKPSTSKSRGSSRTKTTCSTPESTASCSKDNELESSQNETILSLLKKFTKSSK